ncbi:hypothetical protein N7491_011255 [Penicillium cf. griseofulvum]|nr:hypothetical protein N7491_011255 [Penicillium cf. griseofulvum]
MRYDKASYKEAYRVFLSSIIGDGRVGLRRTVQVNLIPMVYNCLRVSKGAWVQIPLLSYLFVFLLLGTIPFIILLIEVEGLWLYFLGLH